MLIASILPLLVSAQKSPWDPLFSAAGVIPESVQISPSKWRGGGAYALKSFNAAWDDWRKLEPTATSLADSLLGARTRMGNVLRIGAGRLDALMPTSNPAKPLSLADAIYACGGTPPEKMQELRKAVETYVPKDVARVAARIIAALPDAARQLKESTPWIDDSQRMGIGVSDALTSEAMTFATTYDDGGLGPHILQMFDHTDIGKLSSAAAAIADSVSISSMRSLRDSGFDLEWPTALGNISICGGGKHEHNLEGSAFVLDTGAENTYIGAKPGTAPLSVVLDLGGHGIFKNCGLAVFGVSELFCFRGANSFQADDSGSGAAVCGVSTIACFEGHNSFECRNLGEGAAVCGIGALSVEGGSNIYKCVSLAQGFGGVRGFGCLLDGQGGDQYLADDEHITNASPQTAQHNVSMSQGAGFGRRANPGDGHSMAGGIGILANGGGNNKFHCGVFGQGVGYWYATGLLVTTGDGNRFDGVWYVQGSAAHYALGCLVNRRGKNFYQASMAQSQGQGHDYSIGLLHDHGGDSEFHAAGDMLGFGIWNGMGLFAVDRGINRFYVGGATLGSVSDHRPNEPCYGLFAAGGTALFEPNAGLPTTGAVWWRQKESKPSLVLGGGVAVNRKTAPQR